MSRVTIGPNQRVIRLTDADIFKLAGMYKTHRDFIAAKFKEMGYEVTEFHSRYRGEEQIAQGLQYYRTDSDIYPMLEIVGTIGKNIRPITVVEVEVDK